MLHLEVDQNGIAQSLRTDNEFEQVFNNQSYYLPEMHKPGLFISLENDFEQFIVDLDKLQGQFGYDNILNLYLPDEAKYCIYAISGTKLAVKLCREAAASAGAQITNIMGEEVTIDMKEE